MDIARLYPDVLHLILQNLPFRDRVRFARVNRQFTEASKTVISLTKTFHLTAPIFRWTSLQSMANLINSCADNLEKMIIAWQPMDREYALAVQERIRFVLGVNFPRLSSIALDVDRNSNPRVYGQLRTFLLMNSNLRALELKNVGQHFLDRGGFSVVCDNLERVELQYCSGEMVLLFSNYCHNLKHLVVDSFIAGADQLNVAFSKWPSLLTLEIHHGLGFGYAFIDSLWQLAALRRLIFGPYSNIYDEILQKISTSFPQLVHLELCLYINLVTSKGMKCLESMKNLRLVKVQCPHSKHLDILQLSRCKCLHVVQFEEPLCSTDVAFFAFHCPDLRQLIIPSISDIDSPYSASVLISLLGGFIQKKLSIIMTGHHSDWEGPDVQSALEKINSVVGQRLSVKFRPPVDSYHFEW